MSSGRRVSWMARRSLLDGISDHVGCSVGLLCFRCQAGGVKGCSDGNEGNCMGKHDLGVFCAF